MGGHFLWVSDWRYLLGGWGVGGYFNKWVGVGGQFFMGQWKLVGVVTRFSVNLLIMVCD